MNQAIQDTLDLIKAPFADVIAKVDSVPAQVDAHAAAEYSRGYDDGKASVVLPDTGTGEKLFTQEDMDSAAATAKVEMAAEMQPQIDSLALVVADLEAEADGLRAQVITAGADAVAALKLELKAQYDAQQVAETAEETGFAALLA